MTRFDARTPQERRTLFAEAITAHRERASAFSTFEADSNPNTDPESENEEVPRPWVQFSENMFNIDVTESELERVHTLVGEFPEFRVDQLESPEDAEATNVRITARSDANRLAAFADRVFTEVYDCPDEYQVWATAV
ncbi:hypothetical protein [Haloquadratum walsbyi]|jgi:hypothetical protein|uniref:DUF7975 domain-containing protein n=1 Tax=Haloquadratum walsbyi J07HQW2 TaxID=1238425 RepID=U1MX09_9EURY|nr:hypothetical protein [Haloquadratum walsbyi]ERG94979.1 MAG: hypothetical protein J07HQW2_01422 [Haloquadratum walsbyi J07HQW2]